ncbi:hypothetical protein AeMF1_002799 [Aphanomyces euteiches]|nr:hypothetical protein AeMF1_002799 [Aphanomyces euteiches]KAH9181122.1 hypothetical protein AeNC1_016901 [Aphanomyces euteiches]
MQFLTSLLVIFCVFSTIAASNIEVHGNLRGVETSPTLLPTLKPSNMTCLAAYKSTIRPVTSAPPQTTRSSSLNLTHWLMISLLASIPMALFCTVVYHCRRSTEDENAQPMTTSSSAPQQTASTSPEWPAPPLINRPSSALTIPTPRPATPVGGAFSDQLDNDQSYQFNHDFSFTSKLSDSTNPSDMSAGVRPSDDVSHQSGKPSSPFSWTSNSSDSSDPGYGGWWGRGSYLVL